MNPIYGALLALLALAQFSLPRRLAFLPLLLAALHLGNQEVIGNLTPSRILIGLGILRLLLSGDRRILIPRNYVDLAFIAFSFIAVLTSFAHPSTESSTPLTYRLGLIWNAHGTYLYGKGYLPTLTDLHRFAKILPICLVPLALGLSAEKLTRYNYYSYIGANSSHVTIRNDSARAAGPFRHPILAGTAGATSLPLSILALRHGTPALGWLGVLSCLAIVVSSSSSGPLAACGITLLALATWRHPKLLKIGAILGLTLAAIFPVISSQNRGPWYLLNYIDLTGGSTGWHRAHLIDRGLAHLGEWWLVGTDYTRHWMPTGVSWSPDHTDLTNYYLHLGVIGGLWLPLILVSQIYVAIRNAIHRASIIRHHNLPDAFAKWMLAATLSAHAVSFISVSYFDQMFVLFFIILGHSSRLLTQEMDK